MTFRLYTDAVLTRDIAGHDLRAGDVVKIIDYQAVPGDEDGYKQLALIPNQNKTARNGRLFI